MSRAIVLTHAAHEGPARLAPLLAARGFALDVRELHLGAPVPEAPEPGTILVVMGGALGVADLPAQPFLRREVALLERCVAARAPVLGICLGAQLLAHAAGSEVKQMGDAGIRRF